MTNFYYKDSGDLPAEKRYGFKGWSTSKFKVDEGKNIEFFDLENDPVEKAINLYPYYETEDVHKIASSIDYFDIKNGVISLKNEYKDTLFEKYKANQLLTKENESVKKYSRRALAKEYVNLLESILGNEQN